MNSFEDHRHIKTTAQRHPCMARRYTFLLFIELDERRNRIGECRTSHDEFSYRDPCGCPFHFDQDGNRILDLPLERFMGQAVVVSVEGAEEITPEQLKDIDFSGVTKILFKTNAWKNPDQFPEEIPLFQKNSVLF